MKIKKGQIILNIFHILLCACIVVPFIIMVSVSLSSEADISKYGYSLFPKKIDLTAYKYVLRNPTQIIDSYKVTFAFSIIGMVMSVFLMALVAYPLSRRITKGKRGVSFYLYFTMLFGGGLVPTYILNTQYLQLNDSFWI